MQGGKRIGAGRKKGSNIYQEPTKPVRVPVSYVEPLSQFLKMLSIMRQQDVPFSFVANCLQNVPIPLFESKVQAGFPSPSSDAIDQTLDLNQHLIDHPHTTFFFKVVGDSMIEAHIQEDDLLIVDRSLSAKNNDIVIAFVDGDVTVKRLIIQSDGVFLKPENKNYPLIPVSNPSDLIVWGVVTSVIHKVR
ncbi:MAG: LexA repressor [Holosporales bacterium]